MFKNIRSLEKVIGRLKPDRCIALFGQPPAHCRGILAQEIPREPILGRMGDEG
jgi:hypothetical protein